MNTRHIRIIKTILSEPLSTMTSLSKECEVSKPTIYDDLYWVDKWLQENRLAVLERSRSGITLKLLVDKETIETLLKSHRPFNAYDIKQRQATLLLYIVNNPRSAAEKLGDFVSVSRTTVLTDVQQLKQDAELHDVKFIYRERRYHFVGQELAVRAWLINTLAPYSTHFLDLRLITGDAISAVLPFVKQSSALAMDVAHLAFHVQYKLTAQGHILQKKDFLTAVPAPADIRNFVGFTYSEYAEFEQLYTAYLIAGFFRFKKRVLEPLPAVDMVAVITQKLIRAFTSLFEKECDELEAFSSIYNHLETAYYRSVLGIVLENPLLATIKEEHETVFLLVKLLIEGYFSNKFFLDNEASYLTILLLSLEERQTQTVGKRIVVVCYEGVTIAHAIKQQLLPLGIQAASIKCCSAHEMTDISCYDLVISTAHLPVVPQGQYLIVNPILQPTDLAQVAIIMGLEPILWMGGEGFTQHVRAWLGEDEYKQMLMTYIEKKSLYKKEEQEEITLEQLITPERVQLVPACASWQDAVTLAAQPLLSDGSITEEYVDAVIANNIKNGPYSILKEGFALPHAQVSATVKRVCMSLLILKEPVGFSPAPEHQVRVILFTAFIDAKIHLNAMMELIEKINDDAWFAHLSGATTVHEVLDLLKNEEIKKCIDEQTH